MNLVSRKNTLLFLAAILVVGLVIMAISLQNQKESLNDMIMEDEMQQQESTDSGAMEEGSMMEEENSMENDEETTDLEEGLQEIEEEVQPVYQ